MRTLMAALSAIGLVLGGAAAVIWHYARLRHNFGWFAYTPLSTSATIHPIQPGWWPAVVIFPSLGLGIGLLTGVVLTRLGWRVIRDRSGTSPALAAPGDDIVES